MKKLRFLLLLLAAVTLCGCVYHPPIQQGNILTESKVSAIHTGMTSEEVVATLGSPVLENMYSDNRMTYVYTNQPSRRVFIAKRLIIQFQNDQVVNIKSNL